MNRSKSLTALGLVLAMLLASSCAKMSTPQKMLTILATGGIAGSAITYYGQAEAAAGIAAGAGSGLLSSGSILIADEQLATAAQERRARENAEQAQKMEQIEGRLKQIETQNAQLIRELRGRAAAGGGGSGV